MAADKKVVFKVTVEADGANATVRDLKGRIVNTQVSVAALRKEFGNFSVNAKKSTEIVGRSVEQLKGRVNSAKGSMTGLKQGLTGVSAASGGATTSVLELGRVVSDAPYGIRGMANNVSQLASNMLFTAQQVDQATGKVIGFNGVLKQMGKTFLGPLGILFAIQAVISAFDYLYGGAKKAEKAITELTSKTYAGSLIAKEYVKELENVNITEDRRAVVTQELIDLVPTLTKADLEYGKNLDDVVLKIESYALAQASRIEIDTLVQKNSEVLAAKNELEAIKNIENQEERVKRMATFIIETGSEISGYYLGFGQEGLISKGNVDATQFEFDRLNRIIDNESDPIIKRIKELTGSLGLKPTKTGRKGGKDKRPKEESLLGFGGVFGDGRTAEDIQAQRDKSSEFFAETLGITNDENLIKMETQMAFHQSMLYNETLFELERTNTAKEGAKERLETQLKYMDAVGGGLQALSQIAGEETAAGKALAVAGATIDTYAAIAGQLKAFSGVPVPGYAIAQAVTTGLFGLANVKKILETSVPGGGGGVGGGGSVPSASRTFDFNLAGSTGQNQLAQTIGSQVQQPIKAYVVGSEITNQQQFDNQIQGEVTIG